MSSFHRPAAAEPAPPTAALQAVTDNLCARICHDFSGPLGTLLGSLECAMEELGGTSAATSSDALLLANDAARGMVARLRLLRAAWSGPEAALEPAALLHLLDGLIGRERLDIDVSALRPAALAAPTARVLLNVLMLAAEALPAGGRIAVGDAQGHAAGSAEAGEAAAGERAIVTLIEGPRACWPPAFAACLAEPGLIAALLGSERRLQAPLTVLAGLNAPVRLSFLLGPADRPAPLLLSLPA